MIGDDGYRMRSFLNILAPFSKNKYNSKEFPIIDVIVLLSKSKGTGEVGARVKITINISLEDNSTSGKERSIGYDRKGASYVRNDKNKCR